ncbi:MAG TPA: aromatic-ring-hydroxylating dioxygenase subunit beta [Candidatus Sulfotelmatobacter sp.]|nr:aromatic-ring-hydroxylating dioxygenase subunit beta [Candidatus Sulfotelmatobacter sp.]
MITAAERDAVLALYGEYGWLIDEGRFDEWLDLFAEDCSYKVVPRENLAQGLPGCLILCENKDMLRDRITSLREANKFNIHVARHLIGLPRVTRAASDMLAVEAAYSVFQSDQDGDSRLFSVGSYVDRLRLTGGVPRFAEKLVIVDTFSIPSLLATPL